MADPAFFAHIRSVSSFSGTKPALSLEYLTKKNMNSIVYIIGAVVVVVVILKVLGLF